MGHKQRLRAGRHEAMPLDDDQEGLEIEVAGQSDAAASQPELEVVEKPDKEPEKAEDEPLTVLKRQLEEASAAREASDKRAAELERRSHEQAQQLEQHQTTELANHKAVLEQAYAVEEAKLADAKRKYAAAHQSGDFDAVADANNEMIRANALMGQYSTAYQELERREKAPKAQPQQTSLEDQFDESVKRMDPRVASWAREHKADILKPGRAEWALAADKLAAAKGLKPGSDEYLDFMDEQMGYEAEESDDSAQDKQAAPAQTTPRTSKRAPAAPPTRNSASSGGRKRVVLTEDDKRQAQGYGVTLEEYAKWKYEAEKSGALSGGRNETLHFKAVAR